MRKHLGLDKPGNRSQHRSELNIDYGKPKKLEQPLASSDEETVYPADKYTKLYNLNKDKVVKSSLRKTPSPHITGPARELP